MMVIGHTIHTTVSHRDSGRCAIADVSATGCDFVEMELHGFSADDIPITIKMSCRLEQTRVSSQSSTLRWTKARRGEQFEITSRALAANQHPIQPHPSFPASSPT